MFRSILFTFIVAIPILSNAQSFTPQGDYCDCKVIFLLEKEEILQGKIKMVIDSVRNLLPCSSEKECIDEDNVFEKFHLNERNIYFDFAKRKFQKA